MDKGKDDIKKLLRELNSENYHLQHYFETMDVPYGMAVTSKVRELLWDLEATLNDTIISSVAIEDVSAEKKPTFDDVVNDDDNNDGKEMAGMDNEKDYEDVLQKELIDIHEGEELFLDDFVRPFEWEDSYDCAKFNDRRGEAIILHSASNKYHLLTARPFLDKICAILNGDDVEIGSFPKIIFEGINCGKEYFRKNILLVNGFELRFEERSPYEKNASLNLMFYLATRIMDKDDALLLSQMKEAGVPFSSFEDYKKCFPYNYSTPWNLGTEKEVLSSLIAFHALRNGVADPVKDIKARVVSCLDDFHAKTSDEQADPETRRACAKELLCCTEDNDNLDIDNLASKLGVKVNNALRSLNEYHDWKKKHFLIKGDILVKATEVDKGQFLINSFHDVPAIAQWQIKCACTDSEFPYMMKIRDWDYKFLEYYNKNFPVLNAIDKIYLPIPFIGKPFKKSVDAWLINNLFLCGLTLRPGATRTFVRGFEQYHNDDDHEGFLKEMEASLDELIRDYSSSVDNSRPKEDLVAGAIYITPVIINALASVMVNGTNSPKEEMFLIFDEDGNVISDEKLAEILETAAKSEPVSSTEESREDKEKILLTDDDDNAKSPLSPFDDFYDL